MTRNICVARSKQRWTNSTEAYPSPPYRSMTRSTRAWEKLQATLRYLTNDLDWRQMPTICLLLLLKCVRNGQQVDVGSLHDLCLLSTTSERVISCTRLCLSWKRNLENLNVENYGNWQRLRITSYRVPQLLFTHPHRYI